MPGGGAGGRIRNPRSEQNHLPGSLDQKKGEPTWKGGLGPSVPKQNGEWKKPPIAFSILKGGLGLSDRIIQYADGSASIQV